MPQGLKFQRDYSPAVDGHSSQTAFQITSRLRATSEQLVESTTYPGLATILRVNRKI